MAGVVFRYHTNRHYYLFALTGGNRARLALHLPLEKTLRVPDWRELASAAFPYDATRYYSLRVENEGPRIRAYIDGKLVLEAEDGELLKGKAGDQRQRPARFQDFRVTTSDVNQTRDRGPHPRARDGAGALRAENPKPKLWKKFDTPGFGAGRNVRFGDLDGDGVPDMLIAQNIPRVRGDAFDQISCLTAVTLDGKVLWQSGRPDPRNGLLTNDTPFQIHDIDGDGRNEVVLVRDFKLQILDGRTGEVKNWVWMPQAPEGKPQRAALSTGERRLDRIRQSLRRQGAPRNPGQGPLHALLGLQQQARTALAGRRTDRPLSVSVRPGRRRTRSDRDRLRALGPHRKAALEPRPGYSTTTPTAS